MAVQVWIGEKPEHPNERRAIVALANGLERLDGLYLILANFSVGGRSIDLVVIKQDAIFIIELKHCDGKVFGDVNGPWFVESANGERKRLNPGRKNPYNQVISYYYSLINFLNEQRPKFVASHKADAVDFRTCKRLVVIAPRIQEGSKLETDWKVELKGLDELPAYLVTERSSEIELTEEEMLAIPRLLHCTRWKEINALLAGVLPQWEAAQPLLPQEQPPAQSAPVQVQQVSSGRPASFWHQARELVATKRGRLAVGLAMAGLIFILVLFSSLRPTSAPLPDQPGIVVSTSEAAGGLNAGGVALSESCVWSVFQPVGRRQSTREGEWENVGVVGAVPALAPDVVVTLEEVNFCGGQIAIIWSVRNNLSDETVVVPLTDENIAVRDSLGNEYRVSQKKTRPTEMKVEPHSEQRGVVVLDRQANLSAPTLVIRLKKHPFGETIWLAEIRSGS